MRRPPNSRCFALAIALAASLLLAPAGARAATITVTTTDEMSTTDCALPEAISSANSNIFFGLCTQGDSSGTDTIDLTGLTGTINLTMTLPSLNTTSQSIAINGPGASQLDLHRQSGGDFRILFVSAGTGGGTASISGLTISNGNLTVVGLGGAGISNLGTLTLNGVTVTGNHMTITSADPAGSGPAPAGGGILNAGDLTLRRSTVSGNAVTATQTGAGNADAAGGGIENVKTLTVERSTVSGNAATATVSSAVSGVSAFAAGGGIRDNSGTGTATIGLSTVSGNQAIANAPAPATATTRGGGIYNQFGSLTATSDTIAFNTGKTSANLAPQASTTLTNTIISNPQGGGPNCGSGTVTSGGFNIESANTCGLGMTSDLHADPLLLPLTNNGGLTQTHALGFGSPALDAGNSTSDPSGGTDQRDTDTGFTRPVDLSVADATGGNGADIGAFEAQTLPLPLPPPLDITPPNTALGSAKITRSKHKARFRFSSNEPGSSFLCKIDKKSFAPCSSPKTYKHLKLGKHKFRVEARDAAGNLDTSPAIKKFKI
jgi:hypothetical protein